MREMACNAETVLAELAWLRALARRLVSDPHRAEDAVQEAAVVALSQPAPTRAPLRAWLAQVLRNAVRQERRASGRRAAREHAAAELARGAAPAAVDVAEQLCWHRRVVAAVHELDEPYRTAIVLRFLHGRSVREIARELGAPPKTVHTRIERGIARLRAKLDREAGGHGAWIAALAPLARAERGWLGLEPRSMPWGFPGAGMLAMGAKQVAVAVGIVVVCGLFTLPFRPGSAPAPDATSAGAPPSAAPDGAVARVPEPAVALERQAVGAPPSSAAPAAEPAPPSAAASLRGVVLDMDGRGVAGIRVVFQPRAPGADAASESAPPAGAGSAAWPAVATAEDGGFEGPLPSSRGTLDVDDERWASVVRPFLDGAPPPVPPTIVVAPRRAYAGRVVDEHGAPIGGAVVEATLDGPWLSSSALRLDPAGGPGSRTVHLLLPLAETTTDERGEFAFRALGLVEGAHLAARRDGYAPGRAELPESSRADLVVVLAPAQASERALRGVVLDERGAPVADALVSLGRGSVKSARDGGFALELEAWQKGGTLRAVKRGHLPAELDVTLPAPAGELVLRLGPPPLAIRGRVVDAAGEPVAGASVWSPDSTYFGQATYDVRGQSILGEVTVEGLVSGAEASDSGPALSIDARTDAEGRFELAGLSPRGYAVLALDPRTLAAAEPVVVAAGSADVVLRLGGATPRRVAGRVTSLAGEPLAHVQVCAGRALAWADAPPPRTRSWEQSVMRAPSNAKTFLQPLAVTGADGRFEIAGLVVEGSHLLLRGSAIVLSERVALDAAADLEQLEVRVAASSRFRVVLGDPREADAFRREAPDPSAQPMFVEVEGHVISTAEVEIVDGRSGIVQCAEGRATVVLLKDGVEVRRTELDFPAGGVHELRP